MARVIDCPKDTITVNSGQEKEPLYFTFKFYLQRSFQICEDCPRGIDAIAAAGTLKKKLDEMDVKAEHLRLEESEYKVLMFVLDWAFANSKWKLAFAVAIKENGYYDAAKNAQEVLVPVEK